MNASRTPRQERRAAIAEPRVPPDGPRIPSIRSDRGTTIIETAIAVGIMSIVLLGLAGMAAMATSLTENQGHLNARTTEYAQDKMEQLLGLAYGDSTSNTAVFPAPITGGTGLTIGGSSDPSSVVAGYVDWLDANGNLLASAGVTAPSGWYYERVWQVQSAGTNLKQVTVTTAVRYSVARAQLPQSTVTAIKSSPF